LVTNLTSSWSAGPVRQQTFPQIQAPPTSGEYIRIQNSVKLHSRFFYVPFTHLAVNFTAPVENHRWIVVLQLRFKCSAAAF
jgi:ribosomal protein S30